MKYVLTIFALSFIFSAEANVIIKGRILHYDGKTIIYYYPTIEGIHTPYWKEIKPDATGKFTIEFMNEGYGTTTLVYKGLLYRFFHDARSMIYFELDQRKIPETKRKRGRDYYLFADSLKQVVSAKITGDYEAVNKFYNRNGRTSYSTTRAVGGNYYSLLIRDAPTPDRASVILDSLMQREFDRIQSLELSVGIENPEAKRMNDEVKQFLQNEVKAFYGGVFLGAMFEKRKDQVFKTMKDSLAAKDIYNEAWEGSIEEFIAAARVNIMPSSNSPDYNDYMEALAYTSAAYKQYDFPQDPDKTLDESIAEDLFHYDTAIFTDKKSAYVHQLTGIQRYLLDQLYYSPGLLHAIYDVEQKNPGSSHLKHFEPLVAKVKASVAASEKDFNKGKIITKNHNSLKSLLKQLEGKSLLIDVWATWCHPCVEEFRHKSKIQSFIGEKKIEVLYISIDKKQWEDRWRQSIKYNELEGYHFRADRNFIEDMWNTLGGFVGAIPRYALVDKHGQIYLPTAARPSDEDNLSKQIVAMLSRN
jgi:thiol-disulfide isomerase/thioredoxin